MLDTFLRKQQNTENNLPEPQSQYQYVTLPSHPFYGCLVEVIREHQSSSYTRCIIANPEHPDFQTVINARWLSDSPPPPKLSGPLPDSVFIPLSVLDKLVHLILSQDKLRRTGYVPSEPIKPSHNLAANTPAAERKAEPLSISSRDGDHRSSSS